MDGKKNGVLIFGISIVLKGLYCCDKAQDHNKREEGRAYLAYTSASHSSQKEVRAEAQDGSLEVGTEAEVMQGAADWRAVMAYSVCFLITPRTPVQWWPCPWGAGPSRIKHASQACPPADLTGVFSKLRFSLLK